MADAFDVDYPRAVLVGLAVATALALVVAASTSSAAFGAYNSAWDGAAGLRTAAEDAGAEPAVVLNTTRYGGVAAEETVAVVLSPDRAYTSREAARVRAFVERGGTLVVAEDYGTHSNALLDAVGASARFDGAPVRDERSNYRSPALPVATNVSASPLTAGVSQLTLNHGTVLERRDARVLVATSAYAYRDTDGDGELDDAESLDTYPVVTVERVGSGRVIAVADPSLFINAMLDRPGNRQFVDNAFAAHDRVVLDYSHAERLPPLALALLVVRRTPLLQALLGVGGVVAVYAWGRGLFSPLTDRLRRDRPAADGSEPSAADVAADLRRRHPEWDAERVNRVTEGVMPRRGESPDEHE
ncbi:MAG: DUF4350 domain-containing protein [Haloferacaceae archaeon]